MATGRPRGRPPKTTAQKIAEGNPGKRKLPTQLLPAIGDSNEIPEPPANLVADGLDMWNRLWTAGKNWLNAEADYFIAKQACEKYMRAEMFRRGIENGTYEEFYTTSAGLIIPHPAIKQMNESLQMMNSALSQLAFNPSDRARLEISLTENSDPILESTEAFQANREEKLRIHQQRVQAREAHMKEKEKWHD